MKKIPSLFVREFRDPRHHGDNPITREVTPGCEWVVAGEGVATRKWDGTAVLVRSGKVYARFDAKRGKAPPADFEPAQEPDPVTGHHPGWVPATRPEDVWIREAFATESEIGPVTDGTYEACGPKIQGNPEGFATHRLIRHGAWIASSAPRNFDGLRAWLERYEIEGIVWHHPDGRMAKIKRRDFGLPWPVEVRRDDT